MSYRQTIGAVANCLDKRRFSCCERPPIIAKATQYSFVELYVAVRGSLQLPKDCSFAASADLALARYINGRKRAREMVCEEQETTPYSFIFFCTDPIQQQPAGIGLGKRSEHASVTSDQYTL